MADLNNVEALVKELKQDTVITNSTYSAIVSQIDGQGVVWVYLAGSSTETPTASTSAEVHAGDAVTVEWRNNKLYIAGNYSSPSAGIVRVANVEQVAQGAQSAATMAYEAANSAQADADRAHAAADEAEGHAQTAMTNAGIAQTAADNALVGLSNVEDVVGVLNWITAHGTMTANGSTALDPSKVYFIVDPNGDYEVGGTHYSIVGEPKAEDRTSYYTLSVDESVQNYVATHLAVNTEGLWLIPDQNGTPSTNGKKVLIATGAGSTYTTAGTYIIDKVNGVDTVLASFAANGAQIGDGTSYNAYIDNNNIQLRKGNEDTFKISSDMMSAKFKDEKVFEVYYSQGNTNAYTHSERFEINSQSQTLVLSEIPQPRTEISISVDVIFDGYPSTVKTFARQNTYIMPWNSALVAPFDWGETWVSAIGYNGEQIPSGSMTVGGRMNYDSADVTGVYISSTLTIQSATISFTWATSQATKDEISFTFGDRSNASYKGLFSSSLGKLLEASGDYSIAEGYGTTASGNRSHAEGSNTVASGYIAHAEGNYTTASYKAAHAEGNNTTASGQSSHAEGSLTNASDLSSHAEGSITTASGSYSHAEGYYTNASGEASHAEGYHTTASGEASHAEGYYVSAMSDYQHVQGKYNVKDSQNLYAFIIGNGDAGGRSNAFTVGWNGDVEASGNITANNLKVATPSISISTTAGTLVSSFVRQYGKVVQLGVTVNNSASVASGGNVFTGTLDTTALRPLTYITGGAYYGAHAIMGSIGTTGTITIRNASSTAVTISGTNTVSVTWTYIVA